MWVYSKQMGFSLIEVLIAWFILSVVLLGIVMFQTSMLKSIDQAYWRSVATVQLESMVERLRANPSPSARLRELAQWNMENSHLLPHGRGNYECHFNICTVKLQWKEKNQQGLTIRALV